MRSIVFMFMCLAHPLWAQCDQWQVVGSDPMAFHIRQMIWDGARFVAVAHNENVNAATVLSSPTGLPPWDYHFLTNGGALDIAYNGSHYMAAGHGGFLAVSTDLAHWERRDLGLTNPVLSVAPGDGFWVALAQNKIFRSVDDGLTWTPVSTVANLRQVRQLGQHLVAVGYGGNIMTSTDGIEWTITNQGIDFTTILWSGSTYLAAGTGPHLLTSTDLINWTPRVIGFDADIRGGAWTGTHFVLTTVPT